jgi:hypothetical protein
VPAAFSRVLQKNSVNEFYFVKMVHITVTNFTRLPLNEIIPHLVCSFGMKKVDFNTSEQVDNQKIAAQFINTFQEFSRFQVEDKISNF